MNDDGKGHTYAEMSTVANTTDGTKIYDALYSCLDGGALECNDWCCSAGKCGTGIVPKDNCIS